MAIYRCSCHKEDHRDKKCQNIVRTKDGLCWYCINHHLVFGPITVQGMEEKARRDRAKKILTRPFRKKKK
jgi:hypothetical protein